MGQLNDTAFHIQIRLLILSHTENLLIFICLKPDCQFEIIRALPWGKGTRHDLQCACELITSLIHISGAVILLQKKLSILIIILEYPVVHDFTG